MKDWFLDKQIWIALVIGCVCVLILFLIDETGPWALILSGLSLVFIGIGGKLFEADSSENWLSISYGGLFKNAIGGVLMLIGWGLMLRGTVTLAIASMILRMD